MTDPNRAFSSACVDAAARIGARLVSSARWDGVGCTWRVVTPDRADPGSHRPVWEAAGPSLYQGTAGVALFLAELYGVTGDDCVRRAARGALEHSIAQVERLGPFTFALHSGRVGVAHALARYAARTGTSWGVEQGRCVLAPLFGKEHLDRGLDVIAGAAGAIPVLLQLARTLALPAAYGSAVALGERLLRTARRSPEGWSWGNGVNGNARDLTGLAHGAAGYAAAFLELWAATGDQRFRYGAEQAIAYETHHFDASTGNWPDYRNSAWAELRLAPTRMHALRESLRRGGEAPRYRRSAMVAWCHGAPGIGLTRIRAHALLHDPRYADQARAAAKTTCEALRTGSGGYSLCHGTFGNCELLVNTSAYFGEPSWRAEVDSRVEEGIARFGSPGGVWPSGSVNALPDPSLMLGESGVGHFLLRLVDPAMPSILLPTTGDVPVRAADDADPAYLALRDEDTDRYFGRTLRAFRRLGALTAGVAWSSAPDQAPGAAAAGSVEAVLAAEQDPRHAELLQDACRVEREFYIATGSLPEFGEELADELRRVPLAAVPWPTALLCAAPCLRVVRTAHDWDTWLADDMLASAPAGNGGAAFVLSRRHRAMHAQRVGEFAATILDALIDRTALGGVTADDLATQLLVDHELSGEAQATIRDQIHDQLRRAYVGGLIVVGGPWQPLPIGTPADTAAGAGRDPAPVAVSAATTLAPTIESVIEPHRGP